MNPGQRGPGLQVLPATLTPCLLQGMTDIPQPLPKTHQPRGRAAPCPESLPYIGILVSCPFCPLTAWLLCLGPPLISLFPSHFSHKAQGHDPSGLSQICLPLTTISSTIPSHAFFFPFYFLFHSDGNSILGRPIFGICRPEVLPFLGTFGIVLVTTPLGL